jgi:hypothetical protein
MARVEFDAKDVLDRYIALIKRTGGQGPQDIARLPAPKDVIKDVLLHVLRKASPDMDATTVKEAFMQLATFQDLPNLAGSSIDDWPDRMTNTSNPPMESNSLPKAAQDTVSLKSRLDSVEERMELERATLAEELARAGF